MSKRKIYAHSDYQTRATTKDKEADFFARCLLMPRELVSSALSPTVIGHSNLREKIALLARVFNVPAETACQRFLELN